MIKNLILASGMCGMLAATVLGQDAPTSASATIPPVTTPADTSEKQKIYYCELTGRFKRDISHVPIEQLFQDARRNKADVIICKIDGDFTRQGDDIQLDYVFDPSEALSGMEFLRQIRTIINRELDDPEWGGERPKLVFWVNKALGGTSMIPFMAPDMYFTSNGHLGGVGYTEWVIGPGADERVRQKWMDMSVTPMEGIALASGYDPKIIRAMFYVEYVLSYELKGGKPVFYERFPDQSNPNEMLLTDDGNKEAGRLDSVEAFVRMTGDDCLTLDAPTAVRLAVAKGIADSLSDLIDQLGLARDGEVLQKTKAEKIIKDWNRSVDDAEKTFLRLFNEFQDTPVRGNYKERQAARGKRINILKKMQAILDRFKDVIDPRAIYGDATGWDVQINIIIDRIKTEMRLDRDEEAEGR